MCCKVYEVPPVDNKPRGVWCRHCKPGSGCGIWQSRPQFCRDFHCHWTFDLSFGDEWKPDKSKLVMNYRPDSNAFVVMVDPGAPGAWRREPYHATLRAMAARLARQQQIVQIVVNHDVTVITPTRDLRIGVHAGDLELKWARRKTPDGETFELVDAVPKNAHAA